MRIDSICTNARHEWYARMDVGCPAYKEMYSNSMNYYVRAQGVQSYSDHWVLQHTKSYPSGDHAQWSYPSECGRFCKEQHAKITLCGHLGQYNFLPHKHHQRMASKNVASICSFPQRLFSEWRWKVHDHQSWLYTVKLLGSQRMFMACKKICPLFFSMP